MSKCGVRPDTTTVVGRRLAAEGAFAADPACRLAMGHGGEHVLQSTSDHPFAEVVGNVENITKDKHSVAFQKWTCQHCGARQTMVEPNKFHTSGGCEECGLVTDIVANGCNFLLIKSTATAAELADVLRGLGNVGPVQ